MTSVSKHTCCGFKIQISENGVIVERPDGEFKKFDNAREGVIVFVENIESYILNALLPEIAAHGYDRYSGERGDKNKEQEN